MKQTQVDAIRVQAERLLQSNLRKGVEGKTGESYKFLSPVPGGYRSQWYWDSCFHAIAMAHVEPEVAQAELRSLIAAQDEDGFIGHITFWASRFFGLSQFWDYGHARPGERIKHSGLIQPPMLAPAVEHVALVSRDASFVPPLMGALDLYHNWLAENRALDDDGLLVIISPYESSMDQSPAFDFPLGLPGRPSRLQINAKDRWLDFKNWLDSYDTERMLQAGRFRVKDAFVNTMYAESLTAMARLHRGIGNGYAASAYLERAAVVSRSIVEKMLDRGRGAFFNLNGPEELRGSPLTVGSLVPLMLEGLPEEIVGEIVERHVQNRERFWLRFPVPSVAATEPSFDPRGSRSLWRGPSWICANWLLWRGLRRHHFNDLADQLATRTINMVSQSGLWEFYNPLSGQGMGHKGYASSALALDMSEGR
ncbi:MAG: trehalase family glycosidase [Dehalococcoidia bacterium]